MMSFIKEDLTITVPLTLEAHRIAQQFHAQQSTSQKAKQIYLNTLAVYTVNFYLGCLGIETELDASDSWNPALQTLANVADLVIKNQGKLECRPVLPEAQVFQVPPEVWSDRIGYIAVQFDQSLTEATLLGFLPTAVAEELPLSKLRSLEDLIEQLHSNVQLQPGQQLVKLSQWLNDVCDAGWETIEALLKPQSPELAFGFRNPASMTLRRPETLAPTVVKRGKLLNLEGISEELALFVGLMSSVSSEMNISVEIYPLGNQMHLPRALQLLILDEEGEAVMQAQARNTKRIQLEFSGETGEYFSVKVILGDASFTESFLI